MKVASCVLAKKVCVLAFAILSVFLLVSMNLTTLASTGGFVPVNLDTYEVWHHIQTIGVLVLRGRKRTLIKCRLILLERK